MQAPDTLHLFTMSYPYGNGEPFIENELNFLASKFNKIYIYPSVSDPAISRIPANATIIDLDSNKIKFSALSVMLKNIRLVISIHFNEIIKSPKKGTYIRHFREFNSRLLKSIVLANRIRSLIKEAPTKKDIFYSFWMNENAMALSILKCRKVIQNFVFRANGFDLYDIQARHNYIPFRPFIFRQVDKMFAVAKKGSDYMK